MIAALPPCAEPPHHSARQTSGWSGPPAARLSVELPDIGPWNEIGWLPCCGLIQINAIARGRPVA
jgi:hypothetical protein